MDVAALHPIPPPSARREAILAAALDAFSEHGLAGASIDEIRRRSGASVGSIYHHFGAKESLAGALYVEGLRRYQEGLVAALRAAATSRDGVEAGVHHHVEWVTANPRLARFLLAGRDAGATLASERPLRELNGRFFAAVMGWVRPRVAAGELRELAPDVRYALWIGPSQELARQWIAGRAAGSLHDAARTLAAAAWRALATEEDHPT